MIETIEVMERKIVCGGREVSILSPEEIEDHWEELAEMLAPAFEGVTELDAATTLRLCQERAAWCFVGVERGRIEVVLVADMQDFPLRRVCNVLAYGGRARSFYWYLDVLELWAGANGASELRGYGGEAAMRLARRHGFRETRRVYVKDIARRIQ